MSDKPSSTSASDVWRIPLSDLDYGTEEESGVLRVLKSKWLSMGQEVQDFEREFAAMLGVKHAFAVANGTAAIHLAYLALGLGEGDEIIQPPINFVASANMTLAMGAEPVFADILSLQEPTIDPAQIAARITPRTKAVVVMHYGGYLCHMAEISALCRERGIAIIEDACHAVGARYQDAQERYPHGRMAGNLSDIGTFSFFSNKNMAVGEGGMVVTERDELAERLRRFRSHGMTTLTWDRHKGHASSYDVVLNGFNYRMDEIRAALGRAQLAKLLHNNQRRMELVRLYRAGLKKITGWKAVFADYSGESACHLQVALAPDEAARTRAAQALRQAGIQTSMHYPCITTFQAFKAYAAAEVPLSLEYAHRAITLPLYPTMTPAQVQEVCAVIAASV